jgi:hypothetical protein
LHNLETLSCVDTGQQSQQKKNAFRNRISSATKTGSFSWGKKVFFLKHNKVLEKITQ